MRETCKECCKCYIPNKGFNNCSLNVVGTVRENDTVCYKIQFTHK